MQRSAQQLGVEPKRISDAALDRLGQFQFPGNVRQLENICHWLTVMAPAQVIEVKDLPPEVLEFPVGAAPESGAFVALSSGMATPHGSLAASDTDQRANEQEGVGLQQGLGSAEANPTSATTMGWELGLEQEALALLNAGRTDVWDELTRRFERKLIEAALATTRGRRIEAAQKLGIGRNTITRKIQELGIDET